MEYITVEVAPMETMVTMSFIAALAVETKEPDRTEFSTTVATEKFIEKYTLLFNDNIKNRVKNLKNLDAALFNDIPNKFDADFFDKLLAKIAKNQKRDTVKLNIPRIQRLKFLDLTKTLREYLDTMSHIHSAIQKNCDAETAGYQEWESGVVNNEPELAKQLYKFKVLVQALPLYFDPDFADDLNFCRELFSSLPALERVIFDFETE